MAPSEITDEDVAALVERWSEAAQLYMDGDLRGYAAIARHADDYSLMPPNGGDARWGFDGSDEAVEWTARTFLGGQAALEVFATYRSGDLAVLVLVERQSGTIAGLAPQDWSMRLTLVFRRDETGWRLVHRHADPLVGKLKDEVYVALARGDHDDR